MRSILITLLLGIYGLSAWGQGLTVSRVHYYNVGDEFHFVDTVRYLSEFYGQFKEIVVAKTVSMDSVSYKILVINDVDSTYRDQAFAIDNKDAPLFIDTSEFTSISRGKYTQPANCRYERFEDQRNGDVIEVAEGLGVTYRKLFAEDGEDFTSYSYGLVYYKKSGKEWGVPVTTDVELESHGFDLVLEPLRFDSLLQISYHGDEAIEDSVQLTMFNTEGLEVLRTMVYKGGVNKILPHDELPSGVYQLHFYFSHRLETRKVIYRKNE